MITDQVIKEIYKRYPKPAKNQADLQLDYYLDMLSANYHLNSDDMEIVVEDLDEFNPFRMFLRRSIHAVLEFDKMIAFVFRSHILFFGKEQPELRVHMKPEEKGSLFSRMFGKR